MVTRYSARMVWQVRVQRKVGADYLRQQKQPRRVAMIVAAVAAIHVVLVIGFMSWGMNFRPPDMLVKVRIIPSTAISYVTPARR